MRRSSNVFACERGEVSLTQLLMAMAVFIGVLGATLGVFQNSVTVNRATGDRNESQDRARRGIETLARELRNLASPTQDQPQAVDKATAFDMVFQTVEPEGPNTGLNASNVKRVRYCVQQGTATVGGKLWRQEQKWTTQTAPAVPSTSGCPATGWGSQTMVADSIVNVANGQSRPAFVFNSASLSDVSSIHVDMYVDLDPQRAPVETRVSTGVFLRNQNRRPTAAFTATRTAQGIVLNGSASSDPEGESLNYVWFDGSTKVGTGIVFTYAAPGNTTRSITLKVYDPAALEGVSATQTVVA